MNDKQLKQGVIDELEFDPRIDATNIGVAVDDGVVTLTGHVSSYAEKSAAERVTRRVKGVHAVAQEIEVRYPSDKQTADDQIASSSAQRPPMEYDDPTGRGSSDRPKRLGYAQRPSQLAIPKERRRKRHPTIVGRHWCYQ